MKECRVCRAVPFYMVFTIRLHVGKVGCLKWNHETEGILLLSLLMKFFLLVESNWFSSWSQASTKPQNFSSIFYILDNFQIFFHVILIIPSRCYCCTTEFTRRRSFLWSVSVGQCQPSMLEYKPTLKLILMEQPTMAFWDWILANRSKF